MANFLIIGPLTRDRIVKKGSVYESIGGAVYYQSAVFSEIGIDNTVVTTLAEKDKDLIHNLQGATEVIPIFTPETMEFENIYPDDNPNHRIQRSCIPDNSINIYDLRNINFEDFNALLLSPLSPADIPLNTLKYLSEEGIPIYLGAQGYLRHQEKCKVVLNPWKDYKNFLMYANFLFLDEMEARIILGRSTESCEEITRILSNFGPEEVIITRGDRGALIYSSKDSKHGIYKIPAFPPSQIVDPTGLGDTFMAAYAVKKLDTDDPEECGIFAAKISSLKMEHKGAFKKLKKNR